MQTGEVDLTSPNLWLVSQLSEQPDTTQKLSVTETLSPDEAAQLDWIGTVEVDNLRLVDRAEKSDVVATQFRLQYSVAEPSRTDRPSARTNYVTRYDGMIPAELVSQNGQRFTLDLSQLPIDSRYFQSGQSAKLTLIAMRSVSRQSTEQALVWQGTL